MFRVKGAILAVFRRYRALQPKSHSDARLTVVALVFSEEDRALLSHLAAEHRWVIHFARTCEEAWEALNERKAQIVLCEREVAGQDWRGVIRKMVSAQHLVCAILISNVADDYLWSEVVSRGGHDVLATPLREENVLRAIRLAWLYWNSSRKYNAGVA